jgi:hypothetical protein
VGDGCCEKALHKCGVCKMAGYCSVKCQKADWKSHKPFCRVWN